MSERKKSVIRLFAAAVLLFTVSAYRQLSIRYWSEDFLRPYLVWAVYMLLLFGWQHTITTKIMQKSMRGHLTAQNIVSILYLTVRFVQDAFLYVNIPWMRFTGYLSISRLSSYHCSGFTAHSISASRRITILLQDYYLQMCSENTPLRLTNGVLGVFFIC